MTPQKVSAVMRGIRILTKHHAEVGPEDPQKWFYQLGKAVNCYHLLWHKSTEFNIKQCCWKKEKGTRIPPELACSHHCLVPRVISPTEQRSAKKKRCLTGSIWAESDLVSWIELPIYNGHRIITNHTSAGRRHLWRPLVQLSAWSSNSRKGGASTDLHGVHIQCDCLLVQGSGREIRTGNEIMITRGAVFTLEPLFPIMLLHAYTITTGISENCTDWLHLQFHWIILLSPSQKLKLPSLLDLVHV